LKEGVFMKKDYSKPVLDTKAYAQFENVFTKCTREPKTSGCSEIPGWPPSESEFTAFKSNRST